MIKIGVLAFQGDVIEHIFALKKAGESLALAAIDIANKLEMLLEERSGDIYMLTQLPQLAGSE